MRIFLILFSLFYSAFSWGQTSTVTQALASDNVLPETVMVTDLATGTDESSSMIAYYPIDSASTSAIQVENTIFSTTAGHPLPQVVHGTSNITTSFASIPLISFKFKHTYTTSKRVFVAYKNNTNTYTFMKPYNSDVGYPNGTYKTVAANSEINIQVKLEDVCGVAGSNCFGDFNSFVNGTLADISTTVQQFFVYFVDPSSLSNGNYNGTNPVDTTAFPGSVFVRVRFSSQVPTPQPQLSSLNLARGDTQLTINYTTGYSNISQDGGPWRTLVLKTISTVTDGDSIFDAVGGALTGACTADGIPGDLGSTRLCYQLYPYQQNGSLTVSNLTNDATYLLTVGHVTKFKFVTKIPTNGTGRPQAIEAFIKEQNCFFLSAGFGDRHFVLDYMRNFRDTVLLKNTLGKMFVNFYYNFAPQYTPIIYQNSMIATIARGIGYGLYYLLNAWMVIASAIAGFLAYLKLKKFL